MLSYYLIGLFSGIVLTLLIKELVDYPIRFSSLKRFMPWIKPAQVIRVDFKAKKKINN